jgi:hypothetical protein
MMKLLLTFALLCAARPVAAGLEPEGFNDCSTGRGYGAGDASFEIIGVDPAACAAECRLRSSCQSFYYTTTWKDWTALDKDGFVFPNNEKCPCCYLFTNAFGDGSVRRDASDRYGTTCNRFIPSPSPSPSPSPASPSPTPSPAMASPPRPSPAQASSTNTYPSPPKPPKMQPVQPAPPPQIAPRQQSSSSTSSTGQVVGLAFGCTAAAAGTVALGVFLWRRRQGRLAGAGDGMKPGFGIDTGIMPVAQHGVLAGSGMAGPPGQAAGAAQQRQAAVGQAAPPQPVLFRV